MPAADIVIRGAREHNLRNVSLTLPRNQLIVMTGVSGSGKSSLAFDTLYAEGQRRYVESLSSYARQFLGQMPKPDVDTITGLAPSISIQQKTGGKNPRSTVGTITEIYDYLRVLFARVGKPGCYQCGRPITAQSREQILEGVLRQPEGTKYSILAPLVQRQKGEFRDLFTDLLKQGFLRARVDGKVVQLTDDLQLDKQMRHTIDVVVDRLVAGKTPRGRVAEAVETALNLAGGKLVVEETGIGSRDSGFAEGEGGRKPSGESEADSSAIPDTRGPIPDRLFSTDYACTHCGISYEPPSPQLFSFNSPLGMCEDCDGLGMRFDFRADRLIEDPSLSIQKGAILLLGKFSKLGRWRKHLYNGVARAIELLLGMKEGAFLKTPWEKLPAEAQRLFLQGLGDRNITFTYRHAGGDWKHGGKYAGFVNELLDDYRKTRNPMRRKQLEKSMEFIGCQSCGGARLSRQARSYRVSGTGYRVSGIADENGKKGESLPVARKSNEKAARKKKTDTLAGEDSTLRGPIPDPRYPSLSLPEVCSLSIAEAAAFFSELDLDETGQFIAEEVLKEIRGRLGFLLRCGLDYLTLDRTAPTLSGGESQRIRLAGQIGCGLVGVVYILDEPSIGLHPRDNDMLLGSLQDLRDQGNTVIVVEHDEDTMRAADHIVDFGPGPGVRGGEVVAEGSLEDLLKSPKSVTGQFLSGKRRIEVPATRRPGSGNAISISGATHHNLRDVTVDIPLGKLVCVTGVSGSGKSSLINDIFWQVLNRDLNGATGSPGAHGGMTGLEHVDKAIDIDQSPIGRTPRSNPATYVKLFDLIRDLYTQLPDSKLRGFKPGRFSFNVAGGRCEACEGHGANKLEMDFLADIWVTCPVCQGRRFTKETLEVRFKGRNIAEVLDMDVQQALEHFENLPKIRNMLQTLHDVGLDYLKLGQPSPTLSGGEAQRVKLARELGKRSTGKTVYILDEPTTGLHFVDIEHLLRVLHGFVEAGNTVVVVEHNLDVLKTADWIIDLGPEGGSGGGRIVCEGTPEEIAACEESHTGRALRSHLNVPSIVRKGRKGQKAEVVPALSSAARKTSVAHSRWQTGGVLREAVDGADQNIVVRGASQHNLQHVDILIPRDQMSVFCGPSGSGKSSLAMDTLYAEGQRRYVESLSSYARQFLGQMPKPKVEHIHGLQPSIAIEQKTVGHTPRSTVGTVTEIYDYLRVLFARLGQQYCPDCQAPVKSQTTDDVIDRLMSYPAETRVLILAPQEVTVGQQYEKLWERLREQGFRRVRIDGATYSLDEVPEIDRRRKHAVEIVVDRVTISSGGRSRLAESVEAAFDLGRGMIRAAVVDEDRPESTWKIEPFSLFRACEKCGRSFEELVPHNFSFNSPLGWCPSCEGLGTQQGTNLSALIADPTRTLADGAVAAWPDPARNALFQQMLTVMARELDIPLDVPFSQLEPLHQRFVLYGAGDQWFSLAEGTPRKRSAKPETRSPKPVLPTKPALSFQYKGLYPAIEEASRVSFPYRQRLYELVGEVPCSACGGSRLREDAGAVRLNGKTVKQLCDLPLNQTLPFLQGLKLDARQKRIAGDLLSEAAGRLTFLVDVGLHYLTLARPLPTLSGGESQRIRLAGQIGRALTGVLYVLDEPTIGLHPSDNGRLLTALRQLRDLGNTVVMVEHDREVLEAADQLFDFGPGAGRLGGTITAHGTPKAMKRSKDSLTGKYLADREQIAIPDQRRMPSSGTEAGGTLTRLATPGGGWLELLGARQNNLRNVDLRIPLGTFTVVTGVSGSGKSSLIQDTLARAIARKLHRASEQPGPFDELHGLEHLGKLIVVDQQPLGNTPASNPATYTGVFEEIRELFARLPESKVRGYRPARFSFNRQGGRCEACEGNGQKKIEMHFLPDVWVECDVCRGQRYNAETLAVKFHGKSIADVLNLPIGEAQKLFENIPRIRGTLGVLCAIGLDYLTLGQSAPTLSGGEAQRVKLAAELARPQSGKTLYLLDEPTTGLHFDDIRKLLKILNSLVDSGNTVVVIEHNLDVIKTADWLIDIGPRAGHEGGWIVAEGTPEDVVAKSRVERPESRAGQKAKRGDGSSGSQPSTLNPQLSLTAQCLAPVLEQGARAERESFDPRSVTAKRKGDLELSQVGKGAKMPWETDGRKWHLHDRIAHNGKPCRWEGAILAQLFDAIEEESGFSAINWNNRSVVEVGGPDKLAGWFIHALTGDEWVLTVKFRVKRQLFDEAELAAALNLADFDDLDDVPVYGRAARVRVKHAKGIWDEVTLALHALTDVATPAFEKFFAQARESFLELAQPEQQDLDELMPWKKLGRKWHMMRKGFLKGKVLWEPTVLEEIVTLIESLDPDLKWDWKQKVLVKIARGSRAIATIVTKRPAGVDLVLDVPLGAIPLGRVSGLGVDPAVESHKEGRDSVCLRFTTTQHVAVPGLKDVLSAWLAASR